MADSIRELIVKNIVATLSTVVIDEEEPVYNNTVQSVQRPQQAGNTYNHSCMVIVDEGDESAEQAPFPYIDKTLEVFVVFMMRQAADDTRAATEALNSLSRDLQKALMTDRTRGGYARDTDPISENPYRAEEGQPELARYLTFQVKYRHLETDPNLSDS